MSTFARDYPASRAKAAFLAIPLPFVFGTTILSSACLLFLVQPLASKLILPWFGGSAAVWTTCMLFFQAGLLLGYLYAHSLASRVPPKLQALCHTILLLLSLGVLPILPNAMWQPRPGSDPTLNVFAVLATSVGLPYLLLSSTSPLLQSWYARARGGVLPYRYFALSNAGSLVALLSYPVLIEPYLTGHQQAWSWSIAYAAFVVLCIGTAVFSIRTHALPQNTEAVEDSGTPTSFQAVAFWLLLAACASVLLLAVTNLLTQNVAPMPFLWVLPLGLYLLTFILCFESGRWYKRVIFLPLVLPALGCLAAGSGPLRNEDIGLIIPLLSVSLFVCCMACHGEMARLKPGARHLTTYYLCLSAGGALGGLFIAFAAPHIFNANYEYPIAWIFCPVLLLVLLWREQARAPRRQLATGLWLTACAATLILAGYTCRETWRDVRGARLLVRNFYGALRVEDGKSRYQQKERELSHGTITHGVQYLFGFHSHQPTTYYAWDSGIGLTWRVLAPKGPLYMGVVGLGAGTLAAYGRSGDTIRFYDINPLVLNIAQTQFTFLSGCLAKHDVILGDARLVLESQSSQQFDILVIDAFSGDSIPVHLLTKEAFRLYFRHLKPDGVLAVHISNRYLDLSPVVGRAGRDFGKTTWEIDNEDDDKLETFSSSYVLLSNRPGFFSDPLFKGQRITVEVPAKFRAWTDDYSNLWQVLKFD